jgi:Acetoacetate decarboxylase (ADC)
MTTARLCWLNSSAGASFPPEPWRLKGALYVSLWRIRMAELPVGGLPTGARLTTLFGRAVVATAFAVYETSGDLAYNEVLVAAPIRLGKRFFSTITHIWVDHPSSIAGARALWSIPKEPAIFQVSRGPGRTFKAIAAISDGQPIAALHFYSRLALPGRWRLRGAIAQAHLDPNSGEEVKITKAQAMASIAFGAATWDFPRAGPLRFLSGRKPFVSARLAEMSLCFGN